MRLKCDKKVIVDRRQLGQIVLHSILLRFCNVSTCIVYGPNVSEMISLYECHFVK